MKWFMPRSVHVDKEGSSNVHLSSGHEQQVPKLLAKISMTNKNPLWNMLKFPNPRSQNIN